MNKHLRITPVVLLTAVALVGTSDPALGAATRRGDISAPVITDMSVNPSSVVLKTKRGGVTTFAITVRATDSGGVDRVTVGLYDPSDSVGRAFRLKRTGGTAVDGVWTGTLVLQNTARRGAWSVRAFATDLASNTSNPDKVYSNVQVTLPTRFRKLYVAADPATGKVVAQALLQQFKSGTGWQSGANRPVTLEFAPAGANSFLQVATARTGSDGMVHFENVTANQTGTWRMTYAGNTGYAAASSVHQVVTVKAPSSGGGTTTEPVPTPSPSPSPAG